MKGIKGKNIFAFVLFCLCVTSCFKRHPINENALLHQRACIEAIELRDHARAQTHCELCLEYDSSMPECLNGIGLIALINNDEEKAKTFFQRALRQNNDFSQARNNLGVIYFSRGEFTTALKYFDRALEIDPSNTDARYNAGLSNFRIGQQKRARGDAENSKQHLVKAKDQIQKLIAIEPTYHSAYRDLGLIELNLYELSAIEDIRNTHLLSAKAAFTTCSEVNSEDDGCYEGLGQTLALLGKYQEAFTNYFRCLNHGPNNSACRNGIVLAYEKSAHAEHGFQNFSKQVLKESENASAHEAFCAALFERGLDNEAAQECEVALRIQPNLCQAQFRLADYFARVLNPERATRHCQAFLSCGKTGMSTEIKRCQEILVTVRG